MVSGITFETIIIGAGLAGLSAAYHLRDRNTLILEQEAIPGGRIRTQKFGAHCYDVGAVLSYDLECAPRDFSPPLAFEELAPIGVFWDGALYRGESVAECLSAIVPPESAAFANMLAAGNGKLSPARLPQQHRDLLNAFFQVIHPGDIEEYLPAFHSHAFLRYHPQHYPDGNYGLIDAYCQRIQAHVEYEAAVESITSTERGMCVLFTQQGTRHETYARAVIVATPAPVALALLSDMREPCRQFLHSIRYGRFTVVALGYKDIICDQEFSYVVTPELPMTTIYKMTFPGSRITVLLVYYCNRASQETRQLPDDELITRTKCAMERVGLNIAGAEQLFAETHRWECGGTIITPESYATWNADVLCAAPGIYLAGDYLYREFPYGMDAAVKSGQETAQHVRRFLQDTSRSTELSSPPKQYFQRLLTLAQKACQQPIPMMCIPPAPQKPFPYGDLVPLGFLLYALRQIVEQNGELAAVLSSLEELLTTRKQGDLWAFHTGHVITATDSSLILLGLNDMKAVEALERFHDGQNGYYPQLWSQEQRPDFMLFTPNVRHWCQADYATTCLVRWHRMRHGLPPSTSLTYLADGFEQRSGLYFANPYLADWALALALCHDDQADELRNKLMQEICASQQNDGAFGEFDQMLSTALAILTLAALGANSDRIAQAQCWIADELDRHPTPDAPIPFYSSDLLEDDPSSFHALLHLKALNGERVAAVGKTYHAISYYEDKSLMILSALTTSALGVAANAFPKTTARAACHPRYQCKTHAEYIARFALPPYIR
ncbi:hypothetical protein U14_02713 [Candidatus Moduliflexus flocculans]|uniref:Amine oxidase domain-containing protein n=1 Tax=Candidatus Moduliflexus flocculans TaxID=1499966 RepID=A0A081BM53_9BACT|nr:hypothetical protein U14_02713 [Candidatus Moduliflexus flocculans]